MSRIRMLICVKQSYKFLLNLFTIHSCVPKMGVWVGATLLWIGCSHPFVGATP
ncbi:hypothetical protein BFAG_02205 [Bacteroides fragilis 3_1_12]|uniref:Lipoprotein n=1 Tax=Bacteroides fragilis 3_1_12 TaxID=457424 RepID=A0ABN0BKV0_BACFG|nr:hypothetical protein BFAG_02205 [Bacteroides fragilis 3_1_12]